MLQIPAYKSSSEIFRDDYAYLSSTSKTFCVHAKTFVEESILKFNLNASTFVVEIASNDGYLLEHVIKRNIPCLGVEPTKLAATIAKDKGIDTLVDFFGYKTADEIVVKNKKANFIIANNVLPHVPDLNDFLRGIASLLDDDGIVSIEFQHLLSLVENGYWDTIYHEHYSYLTLEFVLKAVEKFDLEVFDVEEITTHGGSLRVYLKHLKSKKIVNKKIINNILIKEKNSLCTSPLTFLNLQKRALKVK